MQTGWNWSPGFEAELIEDAGQAPSFAAAWDQWRGQTVDENRLRHVEELRLLGRSCFLKRFHGIQWKNQLKLAAQKPRCASQAGREAKIIAALAARGFHPPKLLAWGAETHAGREQRSMILTEDLHGTPLSDVSLPVRREILCDAAEELGRTVQAGIFLPDLGLDHSYVLEHEGFHGKPRWGLLDFHNARLCKRPRRRELARALVRFFRSPGAEPCLDLKTSFAKTYLEACGRMDAFPLALRFFSARIPAPEPISNPT